MRLPGPGIARRGLTALIGAAVALSAAGAHAAPSSSAVPSSAKDAGVMRGSAREWGEAERLVVAVEPGTGDPGVRDGIRGAGGSLLRRSARLDAYVVKVPRGRDAADVAAAIVKGAAGTVRYVQPDGRAHVAMAPTDPRYPEQWHLPKVGAPAAWDLTRGDPGVVIAIVDTGVDLDHPDLVARLDTVNDCDLVDHDYVADDVYGHGTHVAGIAAATMYNGAGGTGVAPSCTLLPVRVLDANGLGYTSDVADGIVWAADHGADVINLSLDTAGWSQYLQEAVVYANMRDAAVFAATGNDSAVVAYPARLGGAVGVASTDRYDARSSFSNGGAGCDLAAPGTGILSTTIGGAMGLKNGTSMATPIAAGTAALVRVSHPTWSAGQSGRQVMGTALDLGAAGRDDVFGYGRVRADLAVGAWAGVAGDAHEPDDGPSQSGEATLGVLYSHTSAPAGDLDVRAFDAVAGWTYALETRRPAGGADPWLFLYDTDGSTLLESNDDRSARDLSSLIVWTAPSSGRYYLCNVDAFSKGGSYEMGVSRTTPAGSGADPFEPDDTPALAKAAMSGVPHTHTSEPYGDPDYHWFDAVDGNVYRIETDRLVGDADTYLRLYAPNGVTQLAAHDDRSYPGDRSSAIVWTARSSGRYLFRNRDEYRVGGTYRVTLTDTGPERRHRVSGADRYAVAVQVAAHAFPAGPFAGVTDVVLASGGDSAAADPLAASGLAGVYRAPILLVDGHRRDRSLPAATRSALAAMAAANHGGVRVHLVGGTESLPAWVVQRVNGIAGARVVERVSGADRYAVAANIASVMRRELGSTFPTTALVANGEDTSRFFDALALAPVAARQHFPVLLVKRDAVPYATGLALRRYGTRWVAGRTSSVSARVQAALSAGRFDGADRYAVASRVATEAIARGWLGATGTVVANRLPDALTGGAAAGLRGATVLFTDAAYLPASTQRHLVARRDDIESCWVLGGTASVSPPVYDAVAAALGQ